jgi:3-methyladenine DNA glycosylase AlkD
MIETLRRELEARANPAKAPDMQAYMKSEMPFLGVQKPGREEIARAVFAAHPLDGFEAWRDTVLRLWREATYREERYLAIRLARDGAALAPVLRERAADDDLWRRRTAIVCQVLRKRDTDLALLCDCIEPNRSDREFFIRKGIGWALRAYAWVDPDEVERYCATHDLSPLSRREALRNLDRIRAT